MPEGGVRSEALAFWRGDFGDSYTARNAVTPERIAQSTRLWSAIMGQRLWDRTPQAILEVGANVGANLHALRTMYPRARLMAVEPNDAARNELIAGGIVHDADVWPHLVDVWSKADLVFTCGVLIHIPPDQLLEFCQQIYRRADRWIACVEYFSAEPEEKVYRGHAGKLWKRDFGSFWLDNFPGLHPLGCGFAWKRETGLDNLTWWLFEKR